MRCRARGIYFHWRRGKSLLPVLTPYVLGIYFASAFHLSLFLYLHTLGFRGAEGSEYVSELDYHSVILSVATTVPLKSYGILY